VSYVFEHLKWRQLIREPVHTYAGPGRTLLPDRLINMIELYTWATPNGRKISIALEELGFDYRVIPVNIGAGEQFAAEFVGFSPNSKIPAIRDGDRTLMESGAILDYLAQKAGALQGEDRWETQQWLMLQMASIGPMFGQTHHFHKFNPGKAAYAEQRFLAETHRLYDVLDRRLSDVEFLAGSYSIADIATFPWVARWQWHSIRWRDYPAVARWFKTIAQRPAVQRGYNVPASEQQIVLPNESNESNESSESSESSE